MHKVKRPRISYNGKKVASILIKIICTVGTATQIYSSSIDYFMYPVNTEVKRLIVPQSMPAVTVCPNWYRSPVYNKNLTKLTVSERYALYGDEESYIDWCSIRLSNGTVVNCSSVTATSTYVGPFGMCFTFFESLNLKVNSSYLTYNDTSVDGGMLQIKVKSPFVSPQRWAMRINAPDEPFIFARRQRSKIYFEPRMHTEITFHFEVSRVYRLKAPYSSGCHDYSDTPYRVRDKAAFNCLISNYKNTTSGIGYWFAFSYVKWKHEFYEETLKYREEGNAQKVFLFPQVNSYCHKLYHLQDCVSTLYTLKIKSAERGSRNNTSIVIQINSLPPYESVKIASAWYSLIEYINSCGGTLSLWFNFAVYTFSCEMYDLLALTVERKLKVKERECNIVSNRTRVRENVSTEKLIDFTIRLICMAGCLYQSYDILGIFLGNNFYFWISTSRPQWVFMPRLTLCVESPLFYNGEYLSEEESESLRFNTSISELFPMTMNVSQIYLKSSIYLNQETMSTRPLTDYYRFEKRLSDKFVCFTTFGEEHYIGNSSYQAYENDQLATAFMFKIYLKFMDPSVVKSLRVYSHFEKTFSMDVTSPESYTVINSQARLTPNLYYWSSNEFRVQLVNTGTRFNCFDYTSINYKSRNDAINNCINDNMKTYRLCPHNVPVNESEGDNLYFARNQSLELSLFNHCEKLYSLTPCNFAIRKLELVNTGFFDTSFQLVLYPPDDDYKKLKQEIRLTLTGLVVYVGGAIGSWLGLAFIDILPLSLRAKRLLKQCRREHELIKSYKVTRNAGRRNRLINYKLGYLYTQ